MCPLVPERLSQSGARWQGARRGSWRPNPGENGPQHAPAVTGEIPAGLAPCPETREKISTKETRMSRGNANAPGRTRALGDWRRRAVSRGLLSLWPAWRCLAALWPRRQRWPSFGTAAKSSGKTSDRASRNRPARVKTVVIFLPASGLPGPAAIARSGRSQVTSPRRAIW